MAPLDDEKAKKVIRQEEATGIEQRRSGLFDIDGEARPWRGNSEIERQQCCGLNRKRSLSDDGCTAARSGNGSSETCLRTAAAIGSDGEATSLQYGAWCSGATATEYRSEELRDEGGKRVLFQFWIRDVDESEGEVVKAIQGLMPLPPKPEDPRMKELEELEKQKAVIDRQAEAYVRRELWVGLGYLVVQTAAFMRLTFWELSWDVMEPICFYVTSMYFMGGYAFFLRTSKEPSFEGFFQRKHAAQTLRRGRENADEEAGNRSWKEGETKEARSALLEKTKEKGGCMRETSPRSR